MKIRFLFGVVALAAMLAVSACGQDGATNQMPVEQDATAVMDATAPEATDAPLQIVDVTPDAEAEGEGEAVPDRGCGDDTRDGKGRLGQPRKAVQMRR